MTTSLSPAQTATLAALFDRIFPAGADGSPSASEIGAVGYVSDALSGPYAEHLPLYTELIAALDLAAGGDFAAAPTDRQDSILALFEANDTSLDALPRPSDYSAFDLIWRHLREGLFCDPRHGGNRGFKGWELIGFPGAQPGYRAEEQQVSHKVARAPQSMDSLGQDARLESAPATIAASEPLPEADVVIIGGGFVGGFMAHRLTAQGKRVVILEAGDSRTGREHAMDELSATAFRNLGGAKKFNSEVPTWRLRPGAPARRASMSQGLETELGGNSVAWGAVAMRFYEDDFEIRSKTVAKYGETSIPADSTLADWPMSYRDLEPYYDMAEDLLGVSGHAGGPRENGRTRGNPFEAPRKHPYPMPALRRSGLGQTFATAAESLGYHPFNLPAAILTAPHKGRHACTYCSFCSRFGCHVDAKASAQNTVLPEALDSGLLTILTGARVTEIVTEDGRAVGARYLTSDGQSHVQRGRQVVLATYAFENTRLLLLSRDEAHPQGLGNNHDQVGRNYMTRQQPSVYAVFDDRKLNRFIGPTAQATAIADLSCDHFDHTGLGFIRGGRVAAFNQYLPIEASGVLPPDVPRYGAAWKEFFVASYNATMMLFIDPEILPSTNNRLDLDPEQTDALGRPVVRITFDIGDNEKAMIPWLQDRAEEIARKMGAARIWRRPALTGPISTHDTGGTRMGHDPETSVTDGFGRVHDTPGLTVIGGSSFVSLPPVNPALTILALSLRAADAIVGDQVAADGKQEEIA
ncbi:GMC family oxidoreductase [Alloyangia pacifica]|uniref:Gluconate 2-dehydrogenase alpha chain n=1 Tax=Alloyangia pacifica TaxID=311180 RepID=A0A1I6UYY3_9RHOB|nr:GMC family oxidoreductase [Alloyangia pacifica]SDI31242.1 gluconate 2-dehydrogenase alpha chain [Alloyangia pacifica]SFT06622.1 gluconate 2-dehydrogenase alpha chain [Alloyangia pacifica]